MEMPDQDNFSDAEAYLCKIQVVILRLILDSNSPTDLRGALQAVPEGRPVAFCGEKALLAVVRGASDLQPAADPLAVANPTEVQDNPNNPGSPLPGHPVNHSPD